MNNDAAPPRTGIRKIRLLLWIAVGLAIAFAAALSYQARTSWKSEAHTGFGGPFTLVGADGRPFSSAALSGKPYAIYFGFTRCGDVCPTTLQRLVRLRRALESDDAFNIVFVTIDPAHDGPKDVGQYAQLFGAPIIGLTGSQGQIDQVKKQYGIFAEPSPHPMAGKEMEHTATVLLFDRKERLTGTISPDDSDRAALIKLKDATA